MSPAASLGSVVEKRYLRAAPYIFVTVQMSRLSIGDSDFIYPQEFTKRKNC